MIMPQPNPIVIEINKCLSRLVGDGDRSGLCNVLKFA